MDQKDEVEKKERDIFLEWLSPEQEKSEALYLELRRKLVLMFRLFEDPEDLADEVIERALNNIEKGKVKFSGKAEHYILKIASFVKKEEFRRRIVFQLDDTVNDPPASERENKFPENLYRIIELCFKELDKKDYEIFLDYTFPPDNLSEKEHRQRVAEKWNISIEHLRVLIYRIRNKLRRCALKKLGEE